MELELQTTVGPRTGRVYVRDPTKCSKISGIKYQCQQRPAPGSRFCQHHIDISRKGSDKARKLQIRGTNCLKSKGKAKAKSKRRRPLKHEKNEDQDSYENMDGEGKGKSKRRRRQHCKQLSYEKSQSKQSKDEDRYEDKDGGGEGKSKRRRLSKQLSYEKFQSEKGKDEDPHEDKDGGTNEKNKLQNSLSDELPLKEVCQIGKNNKHIERKLYMMKRVCDCMYQLKLDISGCSVYKSWSWIEHQKLKSFDEENLNIEEWRKINNLPLN
ncbi:hypothetical protein SUGI_0674670 [Cryptomeria japonica]|nr:hypothetical protein SUGI_0674670 [Cryptomeria japonica]